MNLRTLRLHFKQVGCAVERVETTWDLAHITVSQMGGIYVETLVVLEY